MLLEVKEISKKYGTFPALKKIPKRKAVAEVETFLEALHLSDVRHKRLSDCSGGMKQRVGIAGALLGNPEIVIVDELTTGLDPEERVTLRNILSTLACTKLVLLSTHIISDIEAAATKIMVLKKGNLLFYDMPETLLHHAEGHVLEYILPKSWSSEELSGVSSMLQTKQGIKIRQVSAKRPYADAVSVGASLEEACLCVSEEVFQ